MTLESVQKAREAYGPATRPIPAIEAAMMAYVALLSTMHDCPALEIHAWHDFQPPLPGPYRLFGCQLWGAPDALLDQIQQAITDAGCTWKLVRYGNPTRAYIYDAG